MFVRNTGLEAKIYLGWDVSPSLAYYTLHTHVHMLIYTQGQLRAISLLTGIAMGGWRKPDNPGKKKNNKQKKTIHWILGMVSRPLLEELKPFGHVVIGK